MKTIKPIIFACLMLIGISATAQNTAAHRLFDKYENEKGFTSVLISEYAFQLMADVTSDNEKDFNEAAQMIKGIRILTADNTTKGPSFLNDMRSAFNLKGNAYKPLMTVKSEGEEVLFYLKEDGKRITEFILLVQEPTNPVMILIEGDNIDLKKLKNIAGNTKIDALNGLDKINSK